MKTIAPYSDNWINCYANMVLSLIRYKNGSVNISYLNDYDYNLQRDTQLGYDDFYFFDYDDNYVKLEDIADTKFVVFDGSEEELIRRIKSIVLNEDAFVAVDVDLYDWIPNSMCYKKYHWNHFSLIADYSAEKNQFICFDETHANYKSFLVSPEKVANSIMKEGNINLIEISHIKESFSRKITLGEIYINAIRIVNDIDSLNNREFFKLDNKGYKERHYMDLIAMYFQRIESKHYRNSSLFMAIDELLDDVLLEKEAEVFLNLAKSWAKIRHAFIRLYLSESNRERKLELLNNNTKDALNTEKELWNDFILKIKSKDLSCCVMM